MSIAHITRWSDWYDKNCVSWLVGGVFLDAFMVQNTVEIAKGLKIILQVTYSENSIPENRGKLFSIVINPLLPETLFPWNFEI